MTQPTPPKPRLAYLDTTKGVLVLLMVVYHSLNYTSQYHLGFRYLSFLPLSFILITGFLLSRVYSARFAAGDSGLVLRLLLRGSRLLLLFTGLNLVAQFVRSPAYGQSVGIAVFFQRWYDVYLAGGSRIAAFEVLLPIAYLLLLAPVLIALAPRYPGFLPVASALLVAGCGVLDHYGVAIANLNFLAVGVVGMLLGRMLPDPSILGRHTWLALLAYIVYFPLGISRGWIFFVQLAGALAALSLICGGGLRLAGSGWWHQRISRIGQYSLVSYIAQIAILQLLSRVLRRPDPLSLEALLLFAGALVLMTLMVEGTDWLRSQSAAANRLYTTMFA